MILYKIEYDFREDLYKFDSSTQDMGAIYNQLPTHILAESFLEAVEKAKENTKDILGNYLSIASVTPKEIGVKIV